MTERWARRQFRAGARSALAILLMAPLAAPPSLEAQTPEHGGLRSAIQVYESGDFPRAMQLMEAIQPSALSTRDQAIRDLFRGFIFLAYGDETQAEGAMESAVRLDASVRPDPALHSPSRLEFFERVRTLAVRPPPVSDQQPVADTIRPPVEEPRPPPPPPAPGILDISSSGRAWAYFTVDGGERYETPRRLTLPAGRYVVRVFRPGFQEIVDTIEMLPGREVSRRYELRRLRPDG